MGIAQFRNLFDTKLECFRTRWHRLVDHVRTETYFRAYDFKQTNVVVYSVNLNKYDDSVVHVLQTYPCVFVNYTEDEDGIALDGRNSYEASKKFRMAAHLLKKVKDADIAVYLDGNVQILDPDFIKNVVQHHSKHMWDLLMSPHEQRETNTQEIDECLQGFKYSSEGLKMQRELMVSKGRLCWCGFNARWLKSPLSKHVTFMMDSWWFLVKMDPYGVANDQICFPKALDLTRTALRPVNFSCNWQKEYMQNKSFYVMLVHTNDILPKASMPLENGQIKERVRLYVMCYNDETYSKARDEFRKYYWAHPIIIRDQNASFENAFYKQLKALQQWGHLDMIGTLSYSAHAKVDVYKIHCFIESGLWKEVDCVFFGKASNSVHESINARSHGPVFKQAWDNLYENMKAEDALDWSPPETLYNYWMCSPKLMEKFIDWNSRLLAHCFSTPLFLEDAHYTGTLSKEKLLHLCGVPHYPIMPFVLERFNVLFFEKYKIKFFGLSSSPHYAFHAIQTE